MAETWTDSRGQVCYIKGKPSPQRLNKWEMREGQTASRVTVGGKSYYPPFKKETKK